MGNCAFLSNLGNLRGGGAVGFEVKGVKTFLRAFLSLCVFVVFRLFCLSSAMIGLGFRVRVRR